MLTFSGVLKPPPDVFKNLQYSSRVIQESLSIIQTWFKPFQLIKTLPDHVKTRRLFKHYLKSLSNLEQFQETLSKCRRVSENYSEVWIRGLGKTLSNFLRPSQTCLGLLKALQTYSRSFDTPLDLYNTFQAFLNHSKNSIDSYVILAHTCYTFTEDSFRLN